MRINISIDDTDLINELQIAERRRGVRDYEYDVRAAYPTASTVEKYPDPVDTEKPLHRVSKRRKLSMSPSAIAARKLRANKRAGKAAQK